MAIPANAEELQTYISKFLDRLGFDDIVTTLGLTAHTADGQSISLRMDLREPISQANGMFSAAALFGAADITGTFLAMAAYTEAGQFPLAVQSNQNFMSNSKSEYAVATARILRGGGSVAVAEVSVADATGKALMHSTFTYVIKERSVGK
ncbi:PaaI family thioesterase [Glutamicibacter creatinolyticus]|uniref:PaaI family thioesterase n=1 Tax=Glutamicibacter creatinolyticus TaxID=162496 RepID=UPI0037C1751E